MAHNTGYDGDYASQYGATGYSGSQYGQSQSQYGYQSSAFQPSGYTQQQWPNQQPQPSGSQSNVTQVHNTNASYGSIHNNRIGTSQAYGQATPSTQSTHNAPTYSSAPSQHRFRPTEAAASPQTSYSYGITSKTNQYEQSVSPAHTLLADPASHVAHPSATATLRPPDSDSRRGQSVVTPTHQQTHHSGDTGSSLSNNANQQSVAGQKRKRAIDEAATPSVLTSRGGLALPPRLGTLQQASSINAPSRDEYIQQAGQRSSSARQATQRHVGASAVLQRATREASNTTNATSSRATPSTSHNQAQGEQSDTFHHAINGQENSWHQQRSYDEQSEGDGHQHRQQNDGSAQTQNIAGGNETSSRETDLLTREQIDALQSAGGRQNQQPANRTAREVPSPANNENQSQQDAQRAVETERNTQPARGASPGRWKASENAGLEDKFARRLTLIPPIIGSHLHYSNKRVPYNPFPDKLDENRKKIFEVNEPMLLTGQQIADYWAHATNIWQRSTKQDGYPGGVGAEVWECRFRRRINMKDSRQPWESRKDGSTRLRVSKLAMLEGLPACEMRIRVAYHTRHADTAEDHSAGLFGCKCLPEWLYIRRTDASGEEHNHEVDLLDKFKRSDAVMEFVKLKAEEGYSYTAVANWFHERYNDVTAQAKFITKQDVANVAQRWRQAHKDVVMRSSIEEPSLEETQSKRAVKLINSTKPDGLMKALAAIFESMPESIKVALPVLEAMQNKVADQDSASSIILQGLRIQAPFPGLPHKFRPPTPPVPRARPPLELPRSQPDFNVRGQTGPGLRWLDPAVGSLPASGQPRVPHPPGSHAPPDDPTVQYAVPHLPHSMPQARPGAPLAAMVGPATPHQQNQRAVHRQSTGSSFPPAGASRPHPAPVPSNDRRASSTISHELHILPLALQSAPRPPMAPPGQPPPGVTYHGSHYGGFGQPAGFSPRPPPASGEPHASREIHGNMSNRGDPDGWRPSWLQPLEKQAANKDASKQVEIDPMQAVEAQLEKELIAHEGNVRLQKYDSEMESALERVPEGDAIAVALDGEMKASQREHSTPLEELQHEPERQVISPPAMMVPSGEVQAEGASVTWAAGGESEANEGLTKQ